MRKRWVLAAAVAGAAYVVLRQQRLGELVEEIPEQDAARDSQDLVGEEHELTSSDGAELRVQVAGPDGGPVVVLAHCWTGSAETWAPVARRLLRAGCRVVRWDQRGHGRSGAGTLGYSIEGLGADLATVLGELDLRGAVLVGHSMGGFTIEALAIHHPEVLEERVRAVVLVGTAAHGIGSSPLAQRPELYSSQLVQGAVENPALGRLLLRGTFGRGAHPHHVEAARRHLVQTPPGVRAGFIRAFAGMDNRAALAEMRVPTTVIAGKLDMLTPLPLARALAEAIPGAELRVLERSGHMLPYEAPDEIVDAVLQQLERVGG